MISHIIYSEEKLMARRPSTVYLPRLCRLTNRYR